MTLTTAPASAPVETVTPIKPSEAIRLGILLAPVPHEGSYFDGVNGACALGAMALGYGYDGPRTDIHEDPDFEEPWEVVQRRLPRDKVSCPDPDNCIHGDSWTSSSMPEAVYHLNDGHDWSRERIADWLEGLGL